MASLCFLCLSLLVLILAHNASSSTGPDEVSFTPVVDAVERRAVCMDGSPAGYHLATGCGNGSKNWIVYLKGDRWWPDNDACQSNRSSPVGSTRSLNSVNLTGILSPNQDINPDFYNWNRAYVIYCDQASFLGDTEVDGQKIKELWEIFDTV